LKVRIGVNKYKGPYEEMMEAVRKDAPMFNEMALEWKIWLVNKEENLLAGVYLCKDEEALEKSLQERKSESQIVPLIQKISSHVFEIIEDVSKLNKAPL